MRVLVLGGLGIVGRAAVADLARSPGVDEVVCADADPRGLERLARFVDVSRVRTVQVDAAAKGDLVALMEKGVDVAIDLLPLPFMRTACEAAIDAGVGLVSTNYGKSLRGLHEPAVRAGVTLMPECGLDPGIDLILYGHAARQFDRLEVLNSYCGGLPEPRACDNALRYKISWNWDMVLNSQLRDSVCIVEGVRREIPGPEQHDNDRIHTIEFPGLGKLEAVPNGDAVHYTDLLGITATIRETGRYLLRYPGWSDFWRPLKALGFLSEDPVAGLPGPVSPKQFLSMFLGPRLQYRDDEKDLVVMHNVFQGVKGGRRMTLVTDLVMERDLGTGLFAMSMGVGYPASIVAQMIGRGEIGSVGLCSPMLDVPYERFIEELARRGVEVKEDVTWED